MKILVIQQKMIGDVLVSSLLCRHLRENLDDPEVHFLANSGCEAVLTGNPYIDEIVLFTPEYSKNKKAFFGFLKQLRTARYDLVIDVYGKLESMITTWFTRAPKRISHRKWYSSAIYTDTIRPGKTRRGSLGLAIENRLNLLSLVLSNLRSPDAIPEIFLGQEEKNEARKSLLNQNIDPSKPLLMIGAVGSEPSKTFPYEYLAQVMDHLILNMPEAILLLNYIPSQKDEIRKLLSHCSPTTRERIREDVYAENLRTFLSYLSHCSFLLSNEGGAVNMAKALQIPTFSIFSPWITRNAWDTLAEDDRHAAVHLVDYKANLFEGLSKKELRKNVQSLYEEFKPELFRDELDDFLKKFSN